MFLSRITITISVSIATKAKKTIMNRRKIDLINLKKAKPIAPAGVNSAYEQTGETSPYFSPMRTRNQRKHLPIKYEKDEKASGLAEARRKTDVPPTLIKEIKTEAVEVSADVSVKKEVKVEEAEAITDVTIKKEPKKRKSGGVKVKSEPASEILPKTKVKSLEDYKQSKWMPNNWEETLENMRTMRSDRAAPVDTMGCHKCADPEADEKTQRFHNLIALMLSSQTKDQTTYDAMNRLKAGNLTPQSMVNIDTDELEKLLCPVSFYKTKAKHIQKASQILIDQYDSDIPPNVAEMVKLPGVGPKMAHICMKTAWNVVSGIGVDTHVHRISNRLKWVSKPTKEPEQTRIELEKWVPFELWSEVNEMMVGFGQTICTPTNPKCGDCLNTKCPSRFIKKK